MKLGQNKPLNKMIAIVVSTSLTFLLAFSAFAQRPIKKAKVGVNATTTARSIMAPPPTPMTNMTPVLSTTASAVAAPEETKSKVSGTLGLAYSRNLVLHADENDAHDMEYAAGLVYVMNPSYSTFAKFAIVQDLKGNNETDFDSNSVGLSHAMIPFGAYFAFSPGASVTLPLSKEQKLRQSFQGGLTIKGGFGFNPTTSPYPNLISGLVFAFNRNAHQFDTTTQGKPNTQTGALQILSLGYKITDQISISASGTHTNLWYYNGTSRDAFGFGQSIDYAPFEALSFSVGHENRGSTLRADGISSNVRILNENTSAIFAGAEYAF